MSNPPEQNQPIPKSLGHYLAMWNETDRDRLRRHLRMAVSESVLFVDPRDYIEGAAALEALVWAQRSDLPDSRFEAASEIDGHHDRFRYHWRRIAGDEILDGFDVTTIDATGRIERVDGFFGPLPLT